MSRPDRLGRLIAEELGECCDGDVEARIETLREYADGATADDADLTALRTLGNGTRQTIVRLLAAAGEELCVCEMTTVVGVSDSAVSHALSDLRDAGLIARRKEGTWRYYEPTERARALLAALDETRGEA